MDRVLLLMLCTVLHCYALPIIHNNSNLIQSDVTNTTLHFVVGSSLNLSWYYQDEDLSKHEEFFCCYLNSDNDIVVFARDADGKQCFFLH